jgi:soluble lytic murein transglycosylase-like protein
MKVTLFVLFLAVPVLQAGTGEITALRDAQGRCVYVNSNDRELRDSLKSGGVAAALQVIDQRKRALPGIDQFIEQTSLEQRLDPRLVRAIIQVESAWNDRARSRKGALGLMQLMPETARRFGVHNAFDARENITGGTRYLRFLLDRFHENLKYTLAAYNAGEKAVAAWGDVPPYEETRAYLDRIGMIYAAQRQETGLSENAISRTVKGNRVIYTNLD